jgi:hypothetical protein
LRSWLLDRQVIDISLQPGYNICAELRQTRTRVINLPYNPLGVCHEMDEQKLAAQRQAYKQALADTIQGIVEALGRKREKGTVIYEKQAD